MSIAPFEIFLKLDGINGESTVRGHEKETAVLSYDQSIDSPGGGGFGGGGGAGKSTFSPVRFRKRIDKTSIPLLLACAVGTHIKDAQFTFRFPGMASAFEFYRVRLRDVQVTRIGQVAGTGEQYPLTFDALAAGSDNHGFLDEVTLDYAKIQWEYPTVGPSGKPAGTVTGGWDLKAHKKL